MLAREHLSGSAEAGEDLVGDEERPVPAGQIPDQVQEFHRPDDHSPSALNHGFHDDRRYPMTRLPQEILEPSAALDAARGADPSHRAGTTGGRVGLELLNQEVRELGMEGIDSPHPHGPQGVAMVGMFQRDEEIPGLAPVLPVLVGHLQSHFHRSGPVVREEDPSQTRRRPPDQLGGQPCRRFVCATGKHDVPQPRSLFLQRAVETGMVVSVDIDPPGGDAVQKAPAGRCMEIDPLGTIDGNRRRRGLHLGERMPDVFPILGYPTAEISHR